MMKKVFFVFSLSVLFVLFGISLSTAIENYRPVINVPVSGSGACTILNFEVGHSFTEYQARFGVSAYDPEDGDITDSIVMSGFETVNMMAVGTYFVEFNVSDSQGLAALPFIREINVRLEGETTPGRCYEQGNLEDVCTRECENFTECSDDLDNDGDDWVDDEDPECHTDFNPQNSQSYDPKIDDEGEPEPVYACSDGLDNDSDGLIDMVDPGCENAGDNDETNPPAPAPPSPPSPPPVIPPHYEPEPEPEAPATSTPPEEPSEPEAPSAPEEPEEPEAPQEPAVCYYLFDFLKIDRDNKPEEVLKLQNFLRGYEGMNLIEPTGVFDEATYEGVLIFQLKYKEDVLAPWGLDEPTGYVYLTTRRKINEIYCQREFPLTPAQLAEIENYRLMLEALKQAPAPEEPAEEIEEPALPEVGIGEEPVEGEGALAGIEIALNPEGGVEMAEGTTTEEESNVLLAGLGGLTGLFDRWDFEVLYSIFAGFVLLDLLLLVLLLAFKTRKARKILAQQTEMPIFTPETIPVPENIPAV